MAEDDFIYWNDILEDYRNGRSENKKCPFCYEGDVIFSKRDRVTRAACLKCGHFIEGRFSDDDVADA